MSYKEELLKKQKEMIGNSISNPLTKVVIDQTQGAFRFGDRETGDLVPVLEIIIFDRYSEYIEFDPELNRITFRSTIEKKASECKDRYSDIFVSELKEAGKKLTYLTHLIGITPEGTPVDFSLKGTGVKAFLEFLNENREYWKNRFLYKLVVELKKEQKGVVKYFVPVFKIEDISEEEAKIILENIDKVTEEYENFVTAYNNPKGRKEKEEEELEEIEAVPTEEDVPF